MNHSTSTIIDSTLTSLVSSTSTSTSIVSSMPMSSSSSSTSASTEELGSLESNNHELNYEDRDDNDEKEHDLLNNNAIINNMNMNSKFNNSNPKFNFKSLPFTLMTILAVALVYFMSNSNSTSNSNTHSDKQRIGQKIRPETIDIDIQSTSIQQQNQRQLQESTNSSFCSQKYSSVADLSYTYYLETKKDEGVNVNVISIIEQLEHSILNDLTDNLLFCSTRRSTRARKYGRQLLGNGLGDGYRNGHGNGYKNGHGKLREMQSVHSRSNNGGYFRDGTNGNGSDSVNSNGNDDSDGNNEANDLVRDFSLNIVGISSNPDDLPSTKSTCTPSEGRECTVVIGTLSLFLEENADFPSVRYAARYTIRESMLNNLYADQIDGLEKVNYVGPNIVMPSSNKVDFGLGQDDNIDGVGSIGSGGNSNMSRLEIVVVATLISTLVGLFGSFVLFKKVYSKQNCMSPCDGTGIDKQYIEDCNLGIPPVGGRRYDKSDGGDDNYNDNDDDSNTTDSRSAGWNMNSLMKNRGGALSAIDENSMAASDAVSLYSNSGNSAISYSTNKSIAMRSVGSVHSEQTMVIRNGRVNRTPSFGDFDDKENFSAPSDSAVMI